MGFMDKVKSIGKKIGSVVKTGAGFIGKVAGAVDSPIGRMVTSIGSKIPVIGGAFSWGASLAPKIKQGAELVERGLTFGEDVVSAVQNKDLSKVGGLIDRGIGIAGDAKSMRPVKNTPVMSRPTRGDAGVPIISMEDL